MPIKSRINLYNKQHEILTIICPFFIHFIFLLSAYQINAQSFMNPVFNVFPSIIPYAIHKLW